MSVPSNLIPTRISQLTPLAEALQGNELVPIVQNGRTLRATVGQLGSFVLPSASYVAPYAGAVSRTLTSKLSDIVSVDDFGATGNGTTNDTAAIQAAIDAVGALGGGGVYIPDGTYSITGLTMRSGVFLFGASKTRTILFLRNGSNADVIIGLNSNALWGTDANAGINNFGISSIQINGNRANNSSGNGIAFYASRPHIVDVDIRDVANHGMRTEWYQFGEQTFGMEGVVRNVTIDRVGNHGWWHRGPHDLSAENIIVIDAGQAATNTWDGINISGPASTRFRNLHTWHRSTAPSITRYGCFNSTLGVEMVNCHFEGSQSANLVAAAQRCFYRDMQIYSARGGRNVILKGPLQFLSGLLGGKFAGSPDVVGVVLGESAGDNVNGCMIDVIAAGQDAGVIDFTFSVGRNIINARGTANAGAIPNIGTPLTTDQVNMRLDGAGGFSFISGLTMPLGTVAAPGLSVLGDTNTGIFSPAADTLAITAGGVEALRASGTGNVNIGGSASAAQSLRVGKSVTGGASANGVRSDGTIQSDVTAGASMFASVPATQAVAFTLATLNHYLASQGSIGAGSAVTTQNGFNVDSTFVGAGTNIGFRGQIPAAANRWNLFMDGSASNFMSGALGIGSQSLAGYNIRVDRQPTGATTFLGVASSGQVQSDVTGAMTYFTTFASLQNIAFTLGSLRHYFADGSSSFGLATATLQAGFVAGSNLIGAVTNYGFRGQIPAGTNRFNLFMDGTAPNHVAGDLRVGTTSADGVASNVVPVVGGIYRTARAAVAGFPDNTATTIFTMPAGNGVWMVSAWIDAASPAAYHETAIIHDNGAGGQRAVVIADASSMTIAVSGKDVRVTQVSGGAQTLNWSAIRIG